MSKLYDWLNTDRCSFCRTALISQKVYVARDRIGTGLVNAFSSNEPMLYNAVDCPRCGKQTILGRYYSKEVEE